MYEVNMKKRQEVYDLYWYFACEKQNIFIKKLKRGLNYSDNFFLFLVVSRYSYINTTSHSFTS